MQVDETNKKNIRMLLAYIVIFFVCIVLVMVMSVYFGTGEHVRVPNLYDRPIASTCYHDHRL